MSAKQNRDLVKSRLRLKQLLDIGDLPKDVNKVSFPYARIPFKPKPMTFDEFEERQKEIMKLRMASSDRPVELTDKTYELILSDSYRAEELRFYQWIQANWDFGDDRPLERQRMERIVPELFKQKEQSIIDEHAKHKRRAILNILGPDSREDFLFLYQCAEDDAEKKNLARSKFTPIARRFYNVGGNVDDPRYYNPLPTMEDKAVNRNEHIRLNINNAMNFDGKRIGIIPEVHRSPYSMTSTLQPNGGAPIRWPNALSSNPAKLELTTNQKPFPPY